MSIPSTCHSIQVKIYKATWLSPHGFSRLLQHAAKSNVTYLTILDTKKSSNYLNSAAGMLARAEEEGAVDQRVTVEDMQGFLA